MMILKKMIRQFFALCAKAIRFTRKTFSRKNYPQATRLDGKRFSNEEFLPFMVTYLQKGHKVILPLKGVSMRPFLENNRDKALLKRAGQPVLGAPVLAEIEPGHFVLHRIVAIQGDDITLRGDGNLACEYCKAENIVADVIGFYRKGRKKLDAVDGRKWRIYSWLWLHLLPIRRYLLALYRYLWIPAFGTMAENVQDTTPDVRLQAPS